MNKKILKIIYKLRERKFSQRKIKKTLKESYSIDIKQNEINRVVNKIPYIRGYSELDLKRILYLYKNVVNTEKVIKYLNQKYEYNLKISQIRCLASEYKVKKEVAKNMYIQSFITRNDEYRIAKLYKDGCTGKEIAEIFGYRTRKSIYDKLEKMKIPRRDWNLIQSENKSYSKFSMEKIDGMEFI